MAALAHKFNAPSGRQLVEALVRARVKTIHQAALGVKGDAQRRAPIAPMPYKDYRANGGETGPRGGHYEIVEPGRLRDSAAVSFEETPDVSSALITFGNEEVDYAYEQHEHPDWKHLGGGEAFFLATAIKAEAGQLAGRLRANVREELGALKVEAKL